MRSILSYHMAEVTISSSILEIVIFHKKKCANMK